MEIIHLLEKAAKSMEYIGKLVGAEDLHCQISNSLIKAKLPKSNLTHSQCHGLSYFKNRIAKQLFPWTSELDLSHRKRIVEKAKTLFKNVHLDTLNKTDNYYKCDENSE